MKPKLIVKAFLLLDLLLCATSLSAQNNEIRKFALLVSSDDGGEERVKLKYSRSDVESLKNILIKLGSVNSSDMITVNNPSEEEFYQQLDNLRSLIADIHDKYKKTEFLFYYSGHSDNEGLLLGEEKVSYKYIRSSIKNLPFDVKIIILDSCSSGALTRAKGGKKRAPYIYNPAYDMRGEAYLTSSSFDEVSQESDKIRASFFTYYLVSGLYGAADVTRDGQVTLSEAYQFAYSKTLSRTEKSSGGPQHPNFDIQMTGTGDVVMTNLRSAQSLLTLNEDVKGQIFVRNSDGQLVAELDKISGQKIDLGLDKGDYNIVLLQKSKMYESRINLDVKEEKILSEENFGLITSNPSEIQRFKGAQNEIPEVGEVKDISDQKRRIVIEIPDLPDLGKLDFLEQFNFQLIPDINNESGPKAISIFLLAGYLPDITFLSVGGLISIVGNQMNGIQYSGIANVVGNSQTGLQAAGIFNINGHNGQGAQISGIFNYNGGDYLGLQFGGIFNINRYSIYGVQMTGIFNIAGDVDGLQFSGIFNKADDLRGLQFGGIFNASRQLDGMQFSGIGNVSGPLNGFQFSGIFNLAEDVKGFQFAGILNYARQMQGIQFGLINIASKGNGLSLGLLNLYLNEEHHAEIWADETGFIKAAYRNSTKNFHYIYGVGTNYYLDAVSFSIGLGGHVPVGDKFSFGLDYLANLVYYSDRNKNSVESIQIGTYSINQWLVIHQIRASVNIQVVKRLALFAGFEMSYARIGDKNGNPNLLFVESYNYGSGIFWPGFFIGARY